MANDAIKIIVNDNNASEAAESATVRRSGGFRVFGRR
jgi:hypothetical protein